MSCSLVVPVKSDSNSICLTVVFTPAGTISARRPGIFIIPKGAKCQLLAAEGLTMYKQCGSRWVQGHQSQPMVSFFFKSVNWVSIIPRRQLQSFYCHIRKKLTWRRRPLPQKQVKEIKSRCHSIQSSKGPDEAKVRRGTGAAAEVTEVTEVKPSLSTLLTLSI